MKTFKKLHSTSIQKHSILNTNQLLKIKGGDKDSGPTLSDVREDDEIE